MKKYLIIAGVLIVFGVFSFIVFGGNNAQIEEAESGLEEEIIDPVESDLEDKLKNEVENPENATETQTKPARNKRSDNPTVTQKPQIFTAFGHSPNNPLPAAETTVTTCTTVPDVDCYIVFSERDGSRVITFERIKTDDQGIAEWIWAGSVDVPSGSWNVVAKAGNKTSSAEVIHVE